MRREFKVLVKMKIKIRKIRKLFWKKQLIIY